MPKQGLRDLQDELYNDGMVLLAVAEILEDKCDAEERIYAATWIEAGVALLGDGSQGPYFQVPKSQDWFSCALQAPDQDFRAVFRMSRGTFNRFCAELGKNPIFTSRGRKPQRHISWQLAAFLIRYGQLGSSVHDTSFKLGIGYGTVVLYCQRVIHALRQLKKTFAAWFTEQEQQESIDVIEEKLGFQIVLEAAMARLYSL
ncbi:hypothetical protein GGX14DRAFT_576259 [Mycena pura]|uniref:Uncharacterized protein n=1 Tax=Mycena pura TaxID=153505 RepID=A0AAD6UXH3_9AGAR|nr:hypothetical protein GGX14DRAFT_576259 [Mycena pura]